MVWNDSTEKPAVHCARARPSAQKTERRGGEVRKVREYRRQIAVGNAEPFCKCRAVLIHRRRGNPAPVASGIVRSAERKLWKLAVHIGSGHGAAHHQMAAAPSVIRSAVRSRLEGAAEIGQSERGYLRRDAQLDCRVVKRRHRGIELRVKIDLSVQLVAVRIESAERTKENLALQAGRRGHLHDLRHLLQLVSDIRSWELRLKRRKALKRRVENFALLERLVHHGARVLDQRNSRVNSEKLLKRDETGIRRG